jgi:hypothetical protein
MLLGIVGVPWQDVATPASLTSDAFDLLTPEELEAQGRWSMILPSPGEDPEDPFMIESIDPRPTGATHPLDPNATVVGPNDGWNSVNGHEQDVIPEDRGDLQFACIFPLAAPRQCDPSNAASCDCNAEEYAKNSPLCEYDSPYADGIQFYDKAYPGVRELEVLRGIGSKGITASICPKNAVGGEIGPPDDRYGYNAAMNLLIERLKPSLQ